MQCVSLNNILNFSVQPPPLLTRIAYATVLTDDEYLSIPEMAYVCQLGARGKLLKSLGKLWDTGRSQATIGFAQTGPPE